MTVAKVTIGTRLTFDNERMPFTVQAQSPSGRYLVCTRPFPLRKTVLYSVLDIKRGLRGVDNTLGNSYGYETRDDCERAAQLFDEGELEFSGRRRPIPLVIRLWRRG